MAVHMELNLPQHFFDSANAENNFESVSERIAKAFLSDILLVKNITRGNDKVHEPDYLSEGNGYEVTFAIAQSMIPQLKGIRSLDSKRRNIEEELISDITNAVHRKAGKTYSCNTSLVIISIETLPIWYYPLWVHDTDPFAQMAWRLRSKKRNDFFQSLYDDYIQTGKFENIYIIQPTYNSQFALFDIGAFGEHTQKYLIGVGTNKPKAFPTYKVTGVGDKDDVFNFQTTVINYVE